MNLGKMFRIIPRMLSLLSSVIPFLKRLGQPKRSSRRLQKSSTVSYAETVIVCLRHEVHVVTASHPAAPLMSILMKRETQTVHLYSVEI